jgi:biopolymer transport protein ExbD
LPQTNSAAKQPPAKLTLTIDKSQKLYVNKTAVSFETIQSTLVEKTGGPKPARADVHSKTGPREVMTEAVLFKGKPNE